MWWVDSEKKKHLIQEQQTYKQQREHFQRHQYRRCVKMVMFLRVVYEFIESKSLKQTLMTGKEHDKRLAWVKAAITGMSTRYGEGLLPVVDFSLEVEDQSGQRLHFYEADWQVIMMGLMLQQ